MKIIAILSAAALAVTGLAATPVEAQRYGYNGHHNGPGYARGYRGNRWSGAQRWRGGPRWRGGNRGYYGRPRGYYGRGYGRTVCRLRPGYYGPVRRCFRVYR